jgi:hypothetical protein
MEPKNMSHYDPNDPNDMRARSSPAEGPDTVRILPDDGTPEPDGEWMAGPAPEAYRGAYAPVRPYDTQANAQEYAPVYPQQPPAQNVTHVHKGPSGCAITVATLGVVLLACVLLTFATLRDGVGGIGRLFQWPSISFFGTPTTTIDTSRPAVIDRVRALSRLETVHYQVEKVVTGESTGPLPEMFTGDKILLVAHGEVIAGVDLGKLQEGDVRVVSETVTIRMPAAEILSHKLDNEKTYVYDRQTGFFSDPDPNLETEIRRAAEAKILEAAGEAGILDQAATNAEQVLRTLVQGLGYEQVRFETRSAPVPTGTPRATAVPSP